jgi:hypothetical protein
MKLKPDTAYKLSNESLGELEGAWIPQEANNIIAFLESDKGVYLQIKIDQWNIEEVK